MVELVVEDDGTGIPERDRIRIFDRGARLDSGKPGTGLGLAIVRDVAEIYDGSVALEESEDLGGLLARLSLPEAASELNLRYFACIPSWCRITSSRSEERRVGKECVSTCRSRWSPYN